MNKRVLIAISGGIDSTISALLLKKQGYEVIAMTMKTWDYATSGGSKKTTGCCSLDDINDARAICVENNIPHYVLDIREEFSDAVMDNFIDEYMIGKTPNPCVNCNTHIKWGALVKRADALGCQYIATGHYAKIRTDNGRYIISKGLDDSKDQSYVLWGLSQEVLARTIFPIGGYYKKDIRQMAFEMGYDAIASKKDSYEICFIPNSDYRGFLSRKREIVGGNFIDSKGNVLGTHDGTPFFTIGQRHGLGINSSHPLYVIDIRPTTKEVVLGKVDELAQKSMLIEKINLIKLDKITEGTEALVKIRYKDRGAMATLYPMDDGHVRVDFFHKVNAITPGQSAVFYDAQNADDVLGGGHILKVL